MKCCLEHCGCSSVSKLTFPVPEALSGFNPQKREEARVREDGEGKGEGGGQEGENEKLDRLNNQQPL